MHEDNFRRVRDNLYEIKVAEYRLFCFFVIPARKTIIITHGMKKGSRMEQSNQIERAERFKEEFFNS